LVSVGLNTWASRGYLHQLGWEFTGGEQVPWPSSLARGPYGWAQVATFVITGLLIMILALAVRDQLPQKRASSFAVVLIALLGVARILAAFRVDVPILSGGSTDTWHGWVHGIAFLLIIATGVLAPLTETGLGTPQFRESVRTERERAAVAGVAGRGLMLASAAALSTFLHWPPCRGTMIMNAIRDKIDDPRTSAQPDRLGANAGRVRRNRS
jgi:Protein of unknown function (DUF998)